MQISMSFMTTPAEARELWHQLDAGSRTALVQCLAQMIAKTTEKTPLEEEPKESPDDR
jgi:hypothetical protein